jgi:hypothetical protein
LDAHERSEYASLTVATRGQDEAKAGGAGGRGAGDRRVELLTGENPGVYDEGMKTCRAAADLLCYRAANVVVIFEGGGIEAQRLGVAIQKLAEE